MKTRMPHVRAATALCTLTALTTLARAQELCDSVQIGNETRTAFSLPERRVEPDMFTLEISEPDVCPDSEAVGLKVKACDREQAPHVLLLDKARGVVARAGPAASAAFVYVTVYCADANELEGDAAESPSVANRISEQALLPLSSIQPSTVRSIFTLTPDSLPLPEVEPPPVQASSMDEYLPPVKLESRFSSLDQSSIPTILTSMLKNLLKERVTPSLGHITDRPPVWSKHPHHGNKETHTPLLQEHPSPSSIKHISKNQNGYYPPIREEDPTLLAQWKNQLHPRPLLPKLLLLLQEQDHPAPIQRKCDSAHSIEDTEQWWAQGPYQDNIDDGIPCQTDYPTDYSADYYTDDMTRGQFPHLAPVHLEEHAHAPQYPDAPERASEYAHEHVHATVHSPGHEHAYAPVHSPAHSAAHEHAHAPIHSPAHAHTSQYAHAFEHAHAPEYSPAHAHDARHPPHAENTYLPLDSFHHYGPNPNTERPLLTSTVRNSLSWVKSAHAVTPKPRMELNHEPVAGEPTEQPWTFLSRLLLSHPTFRDSTHVIRIRLSHT